MSTFQQFFPGGGSSSGGGVPATTTVAEVLVVGGGQSGNMSCLPCGCPGTGGTGGGVLMSSGWNFEQGCVYTVTVGAGGPGASPGSFKPGTDSSILGYNAPPMGLVGRAAQCYCASSGQAAIVPTHTVNGNTYHYGTETSFSDRFCSPSPPTKFLGHNSAGGAGHPGRGPDMMMSLAVGSASFIMMKNLLFPGGDGMFSDITGTDAYYGPGGHGMYASINIPCITNNSLAATTSCIAGRPSISCAGSINSLTPLSLTAACANYGAGGAGQYITCGCANSAGGSGIVFVRYPTEYNAAASVSGNTPTPAQAGYHVYRFNGDGSITF